MPRLITCTQELVNPLELRPQEINIWDIAHPLSQICRFTGHSPFHYSVAQHCCLLAQRVPEELKLQALLHDAAEAYLNDIAGPIKHLYSIDGQPFRVAEAHTLTSILKGLGHSPTISNRVMEHDAQLCEDELKTFFNYGNGNAIEIPEMQPMDAKSEFLTLYAKYR